MICMRVIICFQLIKFLIDRMSSKDNPELYLINSLQILNHLFFLILVADSDI